MEGVTVMNSHRSTRAITEELAAAVRHTHELEQELRQSLDRDDRERNRKEKNKWRCKRYRTRRQKNHVTTCESAKSEQKNHVTTWRGITFRDMPGKNPDAQKLNLSLLRLRDIPRLCSCYDLHGDALKAELARIKGINRDKSLRAIGQTNQPPAP